MLLSLSLPAETGLNLIASNTTRDPVEEDITISIFNSLGQKVIHLKSPKHPEGNHTFTWNGKNSKSKEIPSGVYFFSIASMTERKTKKLVYLK